MTTNIAPSRKFQFIGGHIGLDFCNTVGGTREGVSRDHLQSYLDFVSWAEQAGLLEKAEVEAILNRASRDPAEAEKVFARAIDLREAIYRIFAAISREQHPRELDLEALNAELAVCLGRRCVVADRKSFSWAWCDGTATLDRLLGSLAHSAADLLTTVERLADIRQCRGEDCGWLFLDSSKNHSRCWCDMRDCGNRAKVRRHRLRHPHPGPVQSR